MRRYEAITSRSAGAKKKMKEHKGSGLALPMEKAPSWLFFAVVKEDHAAAP